MVVYKVTLARSRPQHAFRVGQQLGHAISAPSNAALGPTTTTLVQLHTAIAKHRSKASIGVQQYLGTQAGWHAVRQAGRELLGCILLSCIKALCRGSRGAVEMHGQAPDSDLHRWDCRAAIQEMPPC